VPGHLKKAFSFIKESKIDESCDPIDFMWEYNPSTPTIVCLDEADLILAFNEDQNSEEARKCCGELLSILDKIKDNPNIYVCITTNYYDRIPDQIKTRIGCRILHTELPGGDKRLFLFNKFLNGYSFSEEDLNKFVNKSEGLCDRNIVLACQDSIELVELAGRELDAAQIISTLEKIKNVESWSAYTARKAKEVAGSHAPQIAVGQILAEGVKATAPVVVKLVKIILGG
jgi:SpoVK/Ycf46/Vps4 family AAA+-type ATPase